MDFDEEFYVEEYHDFESLVTRIDKAAEVLGIDNVLDISDITDQEIDDLIRLTIIRDTINF